MFAGIPIIVLQKPIPSSNSSSFSLQRIGGSGFFLALPSPSRLLFLSGTGCFCPGLGRLRPPSSFVFINCFPSLPFFLSASPALSLPLSLALSLPHFVRSSSAPLFSLSFPFSPPANGPSTDPSIHRSTNQPIHAAKRIGLLLSPPQKRTSRRFLCPVTAPAPLPDHFLLLCSLLPGPDVRPAASKCESYKRSTSRARRHRPGCQVPSAYSTELPGLQRLGTPPPPPPWPSSC
ncbi:hypothetical protein J3F83DRAFT_346377 [Trichoderma novae-zelandiae]